MKKVIFIMALSLTSVFLSSSYAQSSQEEIKPKTRAEVIAELKKARENGELDRYKVDTFPDLNFKSTKTREEVLKELAEYRKTHPFNSYDIVEKGL